MANDNYNLYTEKIKEKPTVKYKWLANLLKLGLLAAFAGVIAGVTFIFVVGLAGDLDKDDSELRQEITIPIDEYPTVSADVENTGDSVHSGENVEDSNNKQEIDSETPDTQEHVEEPFNVYDHVTEMVSEMSHTMVQVTAINRNADPLFAVVENEVDYPGIVIGDNEIEYLILTNYLINDVDLIKVTFADGNSVNASMVMADQVTGIAVIAVSHEDIRTETRNTIKIAEMGNSYMLKQGELIVAIGNMYGIESAVDFGAAVSTKEISYEADSRHGLVYTNMSGIKNNSGFIFNETGQLIGNISAKHSVDNIVAYGISDIKLRIQNMVNCKPIGYLGIIGREVDEDTSKEYDMPVGVYVTSIENNSPAYFSGIMIGDIIIDINGRTISNLFSIERAMCEFEPGTEVTVKVQRKGREGYVPIEFTITLSEK